MKSYEWNFGFGLNKKSFIKLKSICRKDHFLAFLDIFHDEFNFRSFIN